MFPEVRKLKVDLVAPDLETRTAILLPLQSLARCKRVACSVYIELSVLSAAEFRGRELAGERWRAQGARRCLAAGSGILPPCPSRIVAANWARPLSAAKTVTTTWVCRGSFGRKVSS
jgi:hypothetical protein